MRFRSTSRRSGGTTARHIEPLEQRQLLSVVAPSFATPVSYNIGTQPSPSVPNVSQDGVATGDLNGDGKLDLAVVHSIDNTVNVLLNKGGGAFSTAVAYPLQSTNSIWVRVADVNGDGKRDLIVLGSKNNNGLIGVLLGNGNGTFKPVVSYAAGGVARGGVGIADFNGDGKPDLVVAQFAAIDSTHSAVDVLINNGSGTFKPFYTVAVPPAARSVAVGDFNKDGKTDLAVADGLGVNNQLDGTYPAGVTIMLGNGHGSFSKAAQYNALPTPDAGSDGHGGGDVVNPELITAGDLNGDGNLDLVLSLYDHNIDIYLGNGNGTFHSAVGADTGEYPRSVAFVDVNHDGKKDLVVDNIGKQSASEPGSIAVLLGNGNGTVQPAIQFTPFNYPGWMTAGDFNGDGRTDLAITRLFDGHSVNVMLGQPPVTVPAPTVTSITPTHGPTSGGTSVTITGTNFLHVTAVRFGSFNATSFTVKSATTIVATAPAESAATVNVTVTNIAGTSPVASADRYTFTSLATLPAPVIFSPGSTAQPGPTITTLTPTFTWRPVTTPGVDGYQLNLYDLTSKKFASFTINGASKSSFTLLAADALAKGHQFVWNLRVLSGGQSGPPSSYFYFQT
ncbi:MAG TPA: FG-GAP-like repeat-containing protein [Tepidisphaeraceae bacterium]|nr:FG-GAP-like repeat-containing protein [Tepidisphaeraceae bacterium]